MSIETRRARIPTFPALETERLILRELTDADGPWYLVQFSRPETMDGQGYPAPPNLEAAIAEMHEFGVDLLERGAGVRWAWCRKADPTVVIGSGTLLDWEDEPESRAEIGYSLVPDAWGQGFATEALREIHRFAFEVMSLDRIEAFVFTDNQRSLAVLERLGYTKDELLPAHFEDAHGVLRDEWRLSIGRP